MYSSVIFTLSVSTGGLPVVDTVLLVGFACQQLLSVLYVCMEDNVAQDFLAADKLRTAKHHLPML